MDINKKEYPFNIPALKNLNELSFDSPVTIFVGENGMGKSTLTEAIAISMRFNPEGGTMNFNFSTTSSHSDLAIRIWHFDTRRPAYYILPGIFLKRAPEQKALLGGPNSHQYPTILELKPFVLFAKLDIILELTKSFPYASLAKTDRYQVPVCLY